MRLAWGSLLRRMVLVFLLAYALVIPAILLVYWDQTRAYTTTVAAGQASTCRSDFLRLMLTADAQRTYLDGYLATAVPEAGASYAAGLEQVAAGRRAVARDVVGIGLESALAPVTQAMDAWLAWAQAAKAEVDASRRPYAHPADVQRGQELYDLFLQRARVFDEAAGIRVAILQNLSDDQQQIAVRDNVLTTVVVIVIVSAVVAILLGTMLRSMGRLAATAQHLSEGADLPVPYAGRQDEVGQLARALVHWREAENVRRAAVEEREILLEQAPVGICRFDERGRLVATNRTLETMLGWTKESVGKPLLQFLHPQTSERDTDAYLDLQEGRLDHHASEMRYTRPDGTVMWGASVTTALSGRDGKPGGFMSIVEDITDRKRHAERAAQIQRTLLPQGAPRIEGYELAGACRPAQDVAGDFYDWTVTDDRQVELTVADVMGKGVAAALVMAVLRTALRAAPADLSPAAQVGLAAGSMSLGAYDEGLFATLFHAHLDVATGVIHYVDAGHGYCAIRRSTGEFVRLTVRSLPVGALNDEGFREGTVVLAPGETLIVYSDGLVEMDERTLALDEFAPEFNGAGAADDLVARLMATASTRPTDDVTVLVLRRLAEPARRDDMTLLDGVGLEIALKCSATGEHLDLVHDALARFWSGLDSVPEDVWRMLFELAVAEVAANIIEHAHPDQMSLRLTADTGSMIAEFTYEGAGWTDIPVAGPLELMAERGRGLFLARTGVDEMSYQRFGSTIHWRLIKRQ